MAALTEQENAERLAAGVPPIGTAMFKLRSLMGNTADPLSPRSRTRDIIVHDRLWWSAPSQFNDPFDCYPVATVGQSRRARAHFAGQIVRAQMAAASRKDRRKVRKDLLGMSRADQLRQFQQTITNMRDELAVCSMSLDATSTLMWGHYAGSHRGIALRFEVCGYFYPTQPYGVSYADERPVIDLVDRDDNARLLEATVLSKASCWRYEHEVRYVEQGSGPGYRSFDPRALRGIVFGAAISLDDEQEVRDWVAQSRKRLKFERATIDPRLYKLVIGSA